jgi:hypothetical protein
MSNTNTGGPAFPSHPKLATEYGFIAKGMTLRDYFAAKAMQSLIVVYHDDKNLVREYAQRAFEIADAMLKAREL